MARRKEMAKTYHESKTCVKVLTGCLSIQSSGGLVWSSVNAAMNIAMHIASTSDGTDSYVNYLPYFK